MKKVLAAVAVFAIVGGALAFTAKKSNVTILQCRVSDQTCQPLTGADAVEGFKPGYTQIEGSLTFNSSLVGQPCATNSNCNDAQIFFLGE
jgi:hypothetical protein